ncbi:MAG TPA: polysaccharide biosynthesis/export family protein [Pseudolabrys sp.]|nr:polysaccharide biosynthesis/export family protein [Pseudolabrys sp.]
MRGCRLFLLTCFALMMAACARHPQPAYYVVDPNTGQAVPVMAQPQQPMMPQQAYAQQTYAQPQYAQPAPQPPQPPSAQSQIPQRGLFTSSRQTYQQQPVYTQPPTVMQYSGQYSGGGTGGPYVAAPYGYASASPYEPAYTLDSGDKLRIVVFGQDGITNSYMVDAGGNVNLPLIGSIPARGYSTAQLTQAITERLKQGYVREPHVSVEVETYRPFFILGEVTNPGQYPYVANMTAETAIAIAGGFAPRANKSKVEITRNMPGQQMHGDVPTNFPLRPGDTVVVKERWF